MHTFWVNEKTKRKSSKRQIEAKAKLEREESIIDWASSHVTTSSKRTSDGLSSFQSSGSGTSRMSFRLSALSSSSRSLRIGRRKSSEDLREQLQELDKLDGPIDEEIAEEISLSSGDIQEFAS
jgi:hypothetical protein